MVVQRLWCQLMAQHFNAATKIKGYAAVSATIDRSKVRLRQHLSHLGNSGGQWEPTQLYCTTVGWPHVTGVSGAQHYLPMDIPLDVPGNEGFTLPQPECPFRESGNERMLRMPLPVFLSGQILVAVAAY